jgi:hypothetical protein
MEAVMFLPTPPSPDQDPQQQSRHVTEATALTVVDLLDQGLSPEDIKNRLFDQGYRAQEAFPLVDRIALGRSQAVGQDMSGGPAAAAGERGHRRLRRRRAQRFTGSDEGVDHEDLPNFQQEYRESLRKAGQNNMMYGGMIFAAGVLITLLTLAVPSLMRGYAILFYGAIFGGAAQFMRGRSQVSQANRS